VRTRKHTKLVQEGGYVAEVEVHLIESEDSWAPYLSLEDAYKLDDVREALRRGDINASGHLHQLHSAGNTVGLFLQEITMNRRKKMVVAIAVVAMVVITATGGYVHYLMQFGAEAAHEMIQA
jgi:hypothetical protein